MAKRGGGATKYKTWLQWRKKGSVSLFQEVALILSRFKKNQNQFPYSYGIGLNTSCYSDLYIGHLSMKTGFCSLKYLIYKPILQIWKLEPREVALFAEGHTTNDMRRQLHSSLLTCMSAYLFIHYTIHVPQLMRQL